MKADSSTTPPAVEPKRRFRSAPKVWQDVFKAIVADDYGGSAITYEMIEAEAARLKHSITRESLRVKFARYKKAGYVRPYVDNTRVKQAQGAFWLTYDGYIFFGLKARQASYPKPKTAMLPTSPSKWGHLASKINPAATTAK